MGKRRSKGYGDPQGKGREAWDVSEVMGGIGRPKAGGPGPELVAKGLPHPDASSALLNKPYGLLTIASERARSGAHLVRPCNGYQSLLP